MKRTQPNTRFAWLVVLPVLAAETGCQPGGYKIVPIPADKTLEEKTLAPGRGFLPPKVAVIDVEGILMNKADMSLFREGEHPVSFLVERLQRAEKDSRVKAVVLRINSPGGSVTASDLMYSQIQAFKRRTGKPVIAAMMDVGASGAYYVACACDEIIAHPTTVTGSIGVVMQTVNLAATLKMIGVETDAIKSGPKKDAGSPLRRMTAEEREIFQDLIEQFFDRFVEVVRTGRPGLTEQGVRELADGRVYSAQQALDAGLIDRIGTLDDATALAKQKADVPEARVVMYKRPLGWKPNIYAQAPQQGPTNVNVIQLNLPSWLTQLNPQFLYLWVP